MIKSNEVEKFMLIFSRCTIREYAVYSPFTLIWLISLVKIIIHVAVVCANLMFHPCCDVLFIEQEWQKLERGKEINFWCDLQQILTVNWPLQTVGWGVSCTWYLEQCRMCLKKKSLQIFLTLTLNILFASWLTTNFLKCAIPSSSSLYSAKYTNTEI